MYWIGDPLASLSLDDNSETLLLSVLVNLRQDFFVLNYILSGTAATGQRRLPSYSKTPQVSITLLEALFLLKFLILNSFPYIRYY